MYAVYTFTKLTGSLVDCRVNHGTELGEAGLPHDTGGTLHLLGAQSCDVRNVTSSCTKARARSRAGLL